MLLDTSGLLCLLDARERSHADAVSFYQAAVRRSTHNYVLSEFVALAVARRVPKAQSLEFVSRLLWSGRIEVVWVDEALHHEAMTLLQVRLDKDWSLCDAVSFILMQRRGELEALTTEHDFEQAGFVRLLTA
ncbi:MAG: PIN domain-containing protein [Acidobacteriota bacterium]|nr:PIN domain-containing protein [Acidobacteriota bacterium]MDQ5838527.1 PIN domain-containing protein [Acidobacteriota bacterium]